MATSRPSHAKPRIIIHRLTGDLRVQHLKATPPSDHIPLAGVMRFRVSQFVRAAVLNFESVVVLISLSYKQRFAELMLLMSTPELKGNLIPMITTPLRRSSVTESVALPTVNQLLCLFLGSAVVWAIEWDDFLEMAANDIDGCGPTRRPSRAYAGDAVSEFSDDV